MSCASQAARSSKSFGLVLTAGFASSCRFRSDRFCYFPAPPLRFTRAEDRRPPDRRRSLSGQRHHREVQLKAATTIAALAGIVTVLAVVPAAAGSTTPTVAMKQ